MPYTKEQVEHTTEVLDSILIEAHKAVSRLHIHVSDRAPLMAAYVNAAAALLAARQDTPVMAGPLPKPPLNIWGGLPGEGSPGTPARGV